MNNSRRLKQILSFILIVVAALITWFQRPQTPTSLPENARTTGTCGEQFVYGKPTYSGSDRTQLVCYKAFAALSSLDKKVPLYSAERILGSETTGDEERTDNFREDETLPEGGRAELSDYLRSGYDRGHMSPAADFRTDPQKMSESFLLSNMVPQNHTLNAEAWAGLEGATRGCARQVGQVYVVTGPIFAGRIKTIGRNRVAVPSAVYKIVVAPNGDSRAFVFANKSARKQKSYLDRTVSIESIERQTGLNFFPQGGVDERGLGKLCTGAFSG
jgi:endonuclease G, mitochondrial